MIPVTVKFSGECMMRKRAYLLELDNIIMAIVVVLVRLSQY